MKKYLIIFLSISLLTSCKAKKVEENVETPQNSWNIEIEKMNFEEFSWKISEQNWKYFYENDDFSVYIPIDENIVFTEKQKDTDFLIFNASKKSTLSFAKESYFGDYKDYFEKSFQELQTDFQTQVKTSKVNINWKQIDLVSIKLDSYFFDIYMFDAWNKVFVLTKQTTLVNEDQILDEIITTFKVK